MIKRSIRCHVHFQVIFRLSCPIFPSACQGDRLFPALRFTVRRWIPVSSEAPLKAPLFPFDIPLRKSDLSCP
ncbi:MAG TPA: hypothetical protein DCS85_08805 [Verrucomicrobiales bacterium]|nr:hypothetical protein [Verrucomicrobiales bacterium]